MEIWQRLVHGPWSGSGSSFSKSCRAVVASAMMKVDECRMWCSISGGRRDGPSAQKVAIMSIKVTKSQHATFS
jgi:hypothetical protein